MIAYFLVIGSVNAENQTGIVNHEPGAPLLEAKVDNDTYTAVCLNHEKKYPHNTPYKITNDTENVSTHVKNIIIKYYRENNTNDYNNLIQCAVWSAVEGKFSVYGFMNLEERAICLQMYNDQTGVVGNTYTDENGIKYIFTLKYGIPETDYSKQNVLLFSYITETEDTPEPDMNKTNTNITNGTVTPKDPNEPKNLVSSGNTREVKNPIASGNTREVKNQWVSKMKTTGIPIISLLLVLLSSLGFIIRRK